MAAAGRGCSPPLSQLRVWATSLALVWRHGGGGRDTAFWGAQLAACALVRAGFQLVKMRVNEASVLQQNLGQVRAFARTQGRQLLLAAFLAILSNWIWFAKRQLAVQWRSSLTRSLHDKYFQGACHYRVTQGPNAIPDADVRITEDVPKLATSVTDFVVTLSNSVLDVGIFSVFLARNGVVGFSLGLVAQLYVVAAYVLSNRLLPVDYASVTEPLAAASAEFQQSFNRAEAHASTICALQGGAAEHQAARSQLQAALRAKRASFTGRHWNEAVQYFLMSSTFDRTPLFWCSFLYFTAGGLQLLVRRRAGAEALLNSSLPSPEVARGWGLIIRYHGAMVSIWLGAITVASALQSMMLNYASVGRLQALLHGLAEAAAPRQALLHTEADLVRFEAVDVETPSGIALVRGLSFCVQRGSCLLLTGHNGAGKSSVMRCLGGLWQPKAGKIWTPGSNGLRSAVYYLPQRPYNVVGTLAEQLCYPELPPKSLSPHELRRWLDYVDLGYLAEHPRAWNAETDWQQVLSLGEQQRLGILRLFYHRPKFAVLDECTSAVTGEIERRLHELCAELQISCITIAHRPALRRYHHQALVLTGRPHDGGGYTLMDVPRAPPCFWVEGQRSDVHAVIGEYLRSRQIPEARNVGPLAALSAQRARVLGARGFAEASSPNGASRPKAPAQRGSPLSHTMTLLSLGLACPEARARAVALLLCLILRTDLYWRAWMSVGRVLLASITADAGSLASGLAWNALHVALLFAADRGSRHLSQQLMLRVWEAISRRVQSLYFKQGALHHALSARHPVTSLAARATEPSAFAEALADAVDDMAKPLCVGVSLLCRALLSDGRAVGLAALVLLTLHALSAALLAPNIRELTWRGLQLEAKFKTLHARFRQNLEPIAFSGGGAAEGHAADASYKAVEEHVVRDARSELVYQMVSTFLLYGDMLPLSVMRLLSAVHVWKRSQSLEHGGLSPSDFLDMWHFDNCTKLGFSTLSKIAAVPDKLSQLEGQAQGITELLEALLSGAAEAAVVAQPPSTPDAEPLLQVEGLSLITPQGKVLALDMSFLATRGSGLLVTGPNASGKSLLAGLLAGLWPPRTGTVRVGRTPRGLRPHWHELLLVPQRPYLGPGGLGSNVAYPQVEDPSDPRLLECLQSAGLGHLAERFGLEVAVSWEEVLSGGEQQRLCVARCLFHRPVFALLDECTSMVSQESEAELYARIGAVGCALVTFSQRLLLPEHHRQELRLGQETEEGWSLGAVDGKRRPRVL